MPSKGASDSLVRSLIRVVGDRWVSARSIEKAVYARDLWPRDMIRAMHAEPVTYEPLAVVWPADTEQVSNVIKIAARHSTAVVPYGAGSGVCGGTVPTGPCVIVDLKRLDRAEIEPETWTVFAGAGCIGQVLEDFLEQSGYTLGHFPSSMYCSSVGGWLAARSAGQMSGKYGKIEDMVMGFEAVLPDGSVLDVKCEREAAGLVQLLLGNEGTLCVFTEARLRLHPLPERRIFRAFGFHGIGDGLEAIRLMYRSGLKPAVARLYDRLDTLIARSYGVKGNTPGLADKLPAGLAKMLPELSSRVIKAVLGRPVVINRAVDMLPGGCMLVVGCEGSGPEVEVEANAAFDICRNLGAQDLGPEPGRHWFEHRYSVSYKQSKVFRSGAFVDTMEVAAPWGLVEGVYKEVRSALERSAFVMAHFSHAYPDGCSIYFTFSAAPWGGSSLEEVYAQVWRTALDTASRAGATITHHHGVGLNKSGFMSRELGGGLRLLEALKRAVDPKGIMNPGKLGI